MYFFKENGISLGVVCLVSSEDCRALLSFLLLWLMQMHHRKQSSRKDPTNSNTQKFENSFMNEPLTMIAPTQKPKTSCCSGMHTISMDAASPGGALAWISTSSPTMVGTAPCKKMSTLILSIGLSNFSLPPATTAELRTNPFHTPHFFNPTSSNRV